MSLTVSVLSYEGFDIRWVGDKPVANDIAQALGYKDPAKTVSTKVSSKYRSVTKTVTVDGKHREVTVLEEAGIYQLIFGSKLPNAEAFQSWVFEEVLPSIRKTGSYSLPQSRRDDLRLSSTEVRKETMAVLQAAGFNKTHHYINVTQMVYRGLFDMDAEQLRKDRGLADDANVRDHLTKQELGMIRTLELMVQQVLVSKVFTSSADLNRYVRTISQHMKSISGVDPKAFVQGGRD